MVEVSEYMKDGGSNQTEWPWKVLIDRDMDEDKWISRLNKGWICYQFNKPIPLRAYGLKSANDVPGRDPKEIAVYI
jgi:hypothetical protein